MRADWTPPGYFQRSLLEWKARQFRDPVQKLAYLRKAASRRTSSLPVRLFAYSALALILILVLGSRLRTVPEVNADLPGEKNETHSGRDDRPDSYPAPLGTAWLVERGPDYEVYSNGLRLESRYLAPNVTRSYVMFRNGLPGSRMSKPAGIVFHTTESLLAPFAPGENDSLTRIGQELLEYVKRRQSYHFLIDRFGRVFRIVPETDVANHAGYSVWADPNGVYVNLNHSFLGISFEAQTRDLHQGPYLNRSQIRSGHLLVEMLVSRYQIPLRNCITHAQVSVDPETMTIGSHTDGSGDFPFRELGLPDNHGMPIPSLFVFGFDYDSRFVMLSGTRIWKGMILADEQLRRDAEARRLPVARHKEMLRENYRASIATLKSLGIIKEN